MKATPIHLVVARAMRLPLHLRVLDLQRLVAAERPRSVRRNELQSLLEGAMFKLLRKGNRAA